MAYKAFLTNLYGLDGALESGGLVNSYRLNTTTRATLYSNSSGTPATENPIEADALGQVTFYYSDAVNYYWRATTADGATVLWEAEVVGGAVTYTYVNFGLHQDFVTSSTGTGAEQTITIAGVTLTSPRQVIVTQDLTYLPPDGVAYTVTNDGTDTQVTLTAPSGALLYLFANAVMGLTGPGIDVENAATLPVDATEATFGVLDENGDKYKVELSAAPVTATGETTPKTVAAALAARPVTVTNLAALLTEEYWSGKLAFVLQRSTTGIGGGLWRFRTGNRSTMVTNDPSQGMFAAPTAASTGSSGAWERVLDNPRLVTPEMFGAVGDGTTDDYAAIQAAVNWLAVVQTGKYRGGTLLLTKRYASSDIILIDDEDTTIAGAGTIERSSVTASSGGAPVIIGTKTSGPVIRVKASHVILRDFEITSSAARLLGTTGTGDNIACAVMIADDDGGGGISGIACERLLLRSQVDDGIHMCGPGTKIKVIDCTANTIGRHGIVFDDGTLAGRSTLEAPGQITIASVRCVDVQGYSVAIGHPSSGAQAPYRVKITDLEQTRCGISSAKCYSTYHASAFIFGNNVQAEICGFGGTTTGNVEDHAAAVVGGADHTYTSCRWVNSAGTHYVHIADFSGITTRDIRIKGGVAALNGSALTYFAKIDAACERIDINDPPFNSSGYTTLTDRTTLTIASGVVAVNLGEHLVDTEGAAATDDLVTINNGNDGQIVRFRSANSGRDTTFKNGTGNIICGADRTLSNVADEIAFRYDAATAKWNMIYFADNA